MEDGSYVGADTPSLYTPRSSNATLWFHPFSFRGFEIKPLFSKGWCMGNNVGAFLIM